MKLLQILILVSVLPLVTRAEEKSADAKKPAASTESRAAQTNVITQVGTWKPIAAILGGARLPKESLDAITLKTTDDTYEVTVAGEKGLDQGTYKLDLTTKPKRMTIVSTNGPNSGKTFLAIYEMKDAESMRVCYDLSGKEFPKEFKAPKDTQFYLVGYRRQKEEWVK